MVQNTIPERRDLCNKIIIPYTFTAISHPLKIEYGIQFGCIGIGSNCNMISNTVDAESFIT